MTRTPRLALLWTSAAAILALALPLPASAIPIHRHVYAKRPLHDGVQQRVLVAVVKDDVAPADGDQDGVADRRDDCPGTPGTVNGCPPAPEPTAASSPAVVASVPAPAVSSVAAPTGGGCVGMSAESGAAGYGAYNPSGGYIGCYQISPDHYAAGGSCAGLGTDPAGQDACAANICATEGAGAWTNSAGQNPCGRLGG